MPVPYERGWQLGGFQALVQKPVTWSSCKTGNIFLIRVK